MTARAGPNHAREGGKRGHTAQPGESAGASSSRARAERRRPPGSAPRPRLSPAGPVSPPGVDTRVQDVGKTPFPRAFSQERGLGQVRLELVLPESQMPSGDAAFRASTAFSPFGLPGTSRAPASTELPASLALHAPSPQFGSTIPAYPVFTKELALHGKGES